jgi:hypothetical protein
LKTHDQVAAIAKATLEIEAQSISALQHFIDLSFVGAVKEIFESNMVPNCKIALCAYLLDIKPNMLQELHPLIKRDKELLKIFTFCKI